MSEKIVIRPETSPESESSHEHHEAHQQKHEVDIKSAEKSQAKQLEQARSLVENQTETQHKTLSKLETQHSESTRPTHHRPPVNKELKNITLKKEMKHIRSKLSKPDKVASKVIHQPVIRVISDTSAKTITRPSGLLGGGITAFLGTSAYYYFTKHIGVKYNYLIFIMLFVVGFGIGLCVELTVWAANSHKKLAR